jgi:hypothetical protein
VIWRLSKNSPAVLHFFNNHLLDKPTRAYKKGAQVQVISFSKLLAGRRATPGPKGSMGAEVDILVHDMACI